MFQVVGKEAANAAGKPLALGIHVLMRVKTREKKFLHPLVLARHGRSQGHQPRAASANLRERLNPLRRQAPASGFNQVGHQRIQQPLESLVESELFLRRRILLFHRPVDSVEEGQALADGGKLSSLAS